MAGDQWGAISIPLAEASPWTAPIILLMMTTISLGVMNLILAVTLTSELLQNLFSSSSPFFFSFPMVSVASKFILLRSPRETKAEVIVEKAAEARERDSARRKQMKDQEREGQMVELARLFDSMDINSNGKLSLDEMLKGFDYNPKFGELMEFMDISREEVEVVFNVLAGQEANNSTVEIDYMEFCKHLNTFQRRDPQMVQTMLKYSVMELRRLLKSDIKQAQAAVAKQSDAVVLVGQSQPTGLMRNSYQWRVC